MFNIYSTEGRIFSGPLESLREYRRVEKVSNSHSANKLENVLNEDELLSKQPYKASKQALDSINNYWRPNRLQALCIRHIK